MFNIAPSRILLSWEHWSICICTAVIVYRVIEKLCSAITLPAILVPQVKGFNFMQFTDLWSVPDSLLLRMNLWIFHGIENKKTPTVAFSASTFFTFFVYSIISCCESTLTVFEGGFKMKTFMWSSLDLGTKHHHILAKIWVTSFLKFRILCMSSVTNSTVFNLWFHVILQASCAVFSFIKAGAGSLFRCKSSQINPAALLWCYGGQQACCYGAGSMCKYEDIPSFGRSFSNQQQPV